MYGTVWSKVAPDADFTVLYMDGYWLSEKQDLILNWIQNNFNRDPTQIQQQPEVQYRY